MQVHIEEINDYDKQKIKDFLKELPLKEILHNKKRILVKPNLLGAFEPSKAVTTNPVVLEALIELLQEMDKTILLGDSPGGTAPVKQVWEKTGIKAIAEKYKVELINFNSSKIVLARSGQIEFPITGFLQDVDAMINVCKYKTHSLMAYTGAIKNLFGLVPGIKKSDYHKEHPDHLKFSQVLQELYEIVKSKLSYNIMDGIIGMEGDGPSAGDPRKFGLMFASSSASALDYIASGMMGFKIEDLHYIHRALEQDGLKPEEIELEKKWHNFRFKNVKIKKIGLMIKIIAYSPQFMIDIFRKLFYYKPDFNDNCKKCHVCVESCPVDAMELTADDEHPQIDRQTCIKCMCCHEMCPHSAIYIKKSILARFILR